MHSTYGPDSENWAGAYKRIGEWCVFPSDASSLWPVLAEAMVHVAHIFISFSTWEVGENSTWDRLKGMLIMHCVFLEIEQMCLHLFSNTCMPKITVVRLAGNGLVLCDSNWWHHNHSFWLLPAFWAGAVEESVEKKHNWMRITGVPWVLEIVKGYKLELDCSTQATSTTHHERKALTQTEIEKMVTKGAIAPVAPCDREIFLLDCYAF